MAYGRRGGELGPEGLAEVRPLRGGEEIAVGEEGLIDYPVEQALLGAGERLRGVGSGLGGVWARVFAILRPKKGSGGWKQGSGGGAEVSRAR